MRSVLCLVFLAIGCTTVISNECETDYDCKGNRICGPDRQCEYPPDLDTAPDLLQPDIQVRVADLANATDLMRTADMMASPPDLTMGTADMVPTCTFADIESQIFTPTCLGFPNCHTNPKGLIGGGLDLSTIAKAWNGLVNVPATYAPAEVRVNPGDPDNSFLWQKLTNRLAPDGSQGQPMPYSEGGPYKMLPDAQLDMVKCWILAGAFND